MIPVDHIEQLRRCGVGVTERCLSKIQRKIKNPVRIALWSRAVGLLIEIPIRERVNIVALRLVVAIVDPTIG